MTLQHRRDFLRRLGLSAAALPLLGGLATLGAPELVGRLTDKFRADNFHVRNLAVEVAVVAALRPTVAPAPAPASPAAAPHAR
jgi:hypothetical protein